MTWTLPTSTPHHLAASAAHLTFVGGAGDFDACGAVRAPGNLDAQADGALASLAAALEVERCTLADVVRLKAYYLSDGSVDEWVLMARLAAGFEDEPLPAISMIPEPLQPFEGQAIQLQAVAQRGWRGLSDIRAATREPPAAHAAPFGGRKLTLALRAGEFIAVPARSALDDPGAAGATAEAAGDAVAQSHAVMDSLGRCLAEVGAGFQDSIKLEGTYFGTTREHWKPMAQARAAHFREPGPVATVVPAELLWPAGARTKVELLAMRRTRGGFDKYIPREDCWPERVWDWPIPLPYRQAIRLRDTIWLGGQVPSAPFDNAVGRVLPGDLVAQTRFTMTYIEDLLRGFARRPADLKLLVAYFVSDGSQAATQRFLDTLAASIGGPLPPVTLVPQTHMQTPETTVEIWGVAEG